MSLLCDIPRPTEQNMNNRRSSTEKIDVFDGVYLGDGNLRSAIADLQLGVFIQDAGAEILYCNRAAAKLFGVTENDILGKTLFDPKWDVLHEDGRPFVTGNHPAAKVINTRQPLRHIIMGIRVPHRTNRVWLELNAYPLFDSDGSVSRVVCTFSDVNARERSLAESRRAALRAQLGAILSRGEGLQSILQAA